MAVALLATTAMAQSRLLRSHGPQAGAPQAQLAMLQAKAVQAMQANTTPDGNSYVGSEFCIACHSSYAGWRDTKHAQALRRPMAQYEGVAGKGPVNDYDQNGVNDFRQALDFNAIASVFDKYKPNAPKLSVEGDAYYVTIGTLKMKVMFTQGGTGEWKQRYGVRLPVSDLATGVSAEIYMTPIQYNEATHAYVLYNDANWYDATTMQPKWTAGMTSAQISAHGGTYSKKCIGCHTTAYREVSQTATGEWLAKNNVAVLYAADNPGYFDYDGDGLAEMVNIGCESCHGPGGKHVMGGGDPTKIANPATMSTEQANEVCGQCHIRVRSVPAGTHEWPYNDSSKQQWNPATGEPLSGFYTDAGGYWPDGIHSKQHHQQYEDLYRSSKPTYQFHQVKCVECHNPHRRTSNKYQIIEERVELGLTIPTSNDNNTLCLACHATFGPFSEITKRQVAELDENIDHIENVVSAHSYHPYGPDREMGLSRCSKCHMPKVATTAVAYDIHSHTFEPIAPEKTIRYQAQGGMPNACAVSCHATKVNSFGLGLDPALTTWNAQFDVDLANALMHYYGPGGLWWDKTLPAASLPDAANYVPPAESDE
jgi:hypothetical protein